MLGHNTAQLKPISVLMVEDNIDHADLMMDALQSFNVGNLVKHLTDGEQAINYLKNTPPFEDTDQFPKPDIIFLDIRMPRQGGIETLRIIKQDPDLQHLPVVMISTSSANPEVEECYSLGASGFITKPLQFDEFSQKMKELNYYWVLTSVIPTTPEA